jgi:hypothetical protein
MIIHDVEQGSTEWYQVRAGIPTASCFDKIITAKTGKLSSQAESYAAFLLAEILLNRPLEKMEAKPFWMERGKELEEDAANTYAIIKDANPIKAGFITTDDEDAGCSVDRLIGEDGILEIKCPAPWTHAENLINSKLDDSYIQQVQGQLYITGRKWCDWMSYHPEMPPVIIRVDRDEEYIDKLKAALVDFNKILTDAINKLKQEGKI